MSHQTATWEQLAPQDRVIEGHAPGTPAGPERLSGLDASFVYTDNDRIHMHTLKLLTLDPTTMVGGYTFERLVAAIGDAATRLPNWCSRLEFGVSGIDHPRWVPDLQFDIHEHVGRVIIAGEPNELDAVISETLSRPLPRDRPLWHATVVEGFMDGQVAVVLKIHHSLADGMAFARILSSITSKTPDPIVPAPEPAHRTVRISKRELTRDALRTWIRHLARTPVLMFHTLWGAIKRVWSRLLGHRHVTELFRGPRLPFNARLSAQRIFAQRSVALSDAKEIKRAFGATVNDVVLAATAEALRSWLRLRGLSTSPSVIAGMPVSAEDGHSDKDRRFGNKVSHIPISLHTDIEDPIDRLAAIHASSSHAKDDLQITGKDLLVRWSELNHPAAIRAVWNLIPRLPRPPINLVLASVPGPPKRLHFAGAEVADLTSVGPLLDGVGLNVTAWSYCDRLNFGLLACPQHVPDLAQLARGIEDAMSFMLERARRQSDDRVSASSREPPARPSLAPAQPSVSVI